MIYIYVKVFHGYLYYYIFVFFEDLKKKMINYNFLEPLETLIYCFLN